MDISSSGPVQPGGVRDQSKISSLGHAQRKVQESAVRRQSADEVEISEQGQLLQKLAQAVRDAPEVREDKVAELRNAIQQGTYHVSANEIAMAILASREK